VVNFTPGDGEFSSYFLFIEFGTRFSQVNKTQGEQRSAALCPPVQSLLADTIALRFLSILRSLIHSTINVNGSVSLLLFSKNYSNINASAGKRELPNRHLPQSTLLGVEVMTECIISLKADPVQPNHPISFKTLCAWLLRGVFAGWSLFNWDNTYRL
jgi:hypothetical protein